MKRFLDKITDSFFKQRCVGPSIFRVSQYSTQAAAISPHSLYHRIQRCNANRGSVAVILDSWVAEGRRICHKELKGFIKEFRKTRQFIPALQIAEWMSHRMKDYTVTAGDAAVHLDLISKVRGLEQAENYFNGLEDRFIDFRVCAALLSCYANAKSLEKAEATMKRIRNMNCCSPLVYTTMLGLYSQMGMHEAVGSLIREMEHKGIDFNEVTYNIMLNAYANYDVEGMEKLLMKMEVDPLVRAGFCSYATAAKGYLKAGALEKASVALKKAEHCINHLDRKVSYGMLMTFYAAMQRKEEVHRLLNMLLSYEKLHYRSYIYIFASLEKLDDLDGAKKILEEWQGKHTQFDIRIPNLVILAYCKKGLVGEAQTILNKLVETGKEPSAKTWDHMAFGYHRNGQMEKAVEMMKAALMAASPSWKPDLTVVAACLEYLKNKRDADQIQEMLMLLEKYRSFSVDVKERIGTYLGIS